MKIPNYFYLHIPFLIMLSALIYNPKLCKLILQISGYFAAGFLISVLLMNPVLKLVKNKKITDFIRKINRHRRIIGVAVFTYACLHICSYFIKKGSLEQFLKFLLHPKIIPGELAWLIFIPLTITSNNYFVKKMGYEKWKSLHKKVYLGECLVFLHVFIINKLHMFLALFFFGILFYFQIKRKKMENL